MLWRETLAVAVASMVGCHLVGGVTDLEFVGVGGGGSGAAGGGSSIGGGTAGGGGEGLTGPCISGETTKCYAGPEGTADVGECREGDAECIDDEWGPCVGEVLPQPEICGNAEDEDCDGIAQAPTGCLSDDGLVARYFVDEGMSGVASGQVLDYGPELEHLDVQSANGKPTWFVEGASRGLRWDGAGDGGRVSKQVTFDTQELIVGSTTATLEMVVHVSGISNTQTGGVFIGGLWAATSEELSLWVNNFFSVYAVAGSTEAGRWSYPDMSQILWGPSRATRVLHAVYDSTAASGADRLVLYVGGVPATVEAAPTVGLDEPLSFASTPHIAFGNIPSGNTDTALGGTVYYMAIYNTAMSAQQVMDHAAILQQSNDGPGG